MTTHIGRTVLVTGANGYVGEFIVAALRTAGHRVLLGGRFPGADVFIGLDKPELIERHLRHGAGLPQIHQGGRDGARARRTMHMLRRDDRHFRAFGEIYFSGVQHGKVKGWYRHREKTLNLAVPAGKVRFVLYDDRTGSPTQGCVEEHLLGEEEARYALLAVPPHIWYGFQGLAAGVSIIASCADLPNDPAESERKPTDSTDIPYPWPTVA